MRKRITAIVLAVLFCVCSVFPGFAAQKKASLEELVNAMTLEPKRPDDPKWKAVIEYVDAAVKDKVTNYDKMNALFDKIVSDKEEKIVGNKLTEDEIFDYDSYLQCAFEVLGFRTYGISGHYHKGDYVWSRASGVGMDIGGEMYFFDARLVADRTFPKESCFAVPAKMSKLYMISMITKWFYITPYEWDGFDYTSDIPEKAEDRADYHAVITGVDSEVHKPDLPPIRVYDRFGNSHTLTFD
jgi:hypothetical protein